MGDWTFVEVELQDLTISKEPFFYASANIKNFDFYKNEILDIIKDCPHTVTEDNVKTDHFINLKRNYLDEVLHLIEPYLKSLKTNLSFEDCLVKFTIDIIWFQQYKSLAAHPWHLHPSCHFSNILFVEKPKDLHTEFYCPITKKILCMPSLKEGSILTFPGYLLHRSSPNKTDKTKTVIVFNTSTFSEYYKDQ